MILLTILIYFVVLIMLLWQVSNFISVFSGSVYVKTRRELINFALKKVDLKKDDVFYDLGCGNADVVIEAQKIGAKVYGVEISPFYFLLSKLRTIFSKDTKIIFGNIKKVDFKNADVVYCYLLPNFLKSIKNEILKNHPKRVVSIGFEIPGLPNKKVYYLNNHKIIVYSLRSCSA